MKHPTGAPTLSPGLRALLIGTVTLTGAVILVFEILGSRLISPFFGSSIYVWSSIIATTLLALATGYWLGGIAADRMPRLDLIYALLLGAALTLLLVPIARNGVLQAASGLGPRGGAFTAAMGLLYLPLTILGMVTPLALKVATDDMARLGRTIGMLTALSTLASAGGVLLGGFVLIPMLGTRNICWLLSITLAVPAVAYFAFRKSLGGIATAAVWGALWLLSVLMGASKTYAGPEGRVVERSESLYGELRVLEYADLRVLMVDGTIQGGIYLKTGRNAFPYQEVMNQIIRAWHVANGGGPRKGLVCGLGPGILPQLVSEIAECEVFELDPRIERAARTYFGLPSRVKVHIGDGRALARRHPGGFDFMVMDAYASEVVPFHLASVEAIREFVRLLKPGGLMVVNTIGLREGPGAVAARAVSETLRQVMPYQFAVTTRPDSNFGNMIFACSTAPLDAVPERVPEFASREAVFPAGRGRILTDDQNPIDVLYADTAREMRLNLWQYVSPRLVLN